MNPNLTPFLSFPLSPFLSVDIEGSINTDIHGDECSVHLSMKIKKSDTEDIFSDMIKKSDIDDIFSEMVTSYLTLSSPLFRIPQQKTQQVLLDWISEKVLIESDFSISKEELNEQITLSYGIKIHSKKYDIDIERSIALTE